MKVMTLTLGFALVASSAHAAAYYVGETVEPTNNITLGFQDTPVKKGGTAAGTNTANIVALELKAGYMATENVSTRLSLPFYFATKNLSGKSANALGNFGFGLGWNDQMTSDDKRWNYGYTLTLDVALPTSRKTAGGLVAATNPTVDFFKYARKSTAVIPMTGIYVGQDMWTVKANLGAAYQYTSTTLPADKNHFAGIGQLGGSFHVLPNFHINAEYNTIWMDEAMRGAGEGKFKHAIAPSLSGNWDNIAGSVYASLPLDKGTRRNTNVAFGANVGYLF